MTKKTQQASDPRPRVMIVIDTYRIGGAGKVILQFLKNVPADALDILLCNFKYKRPKSREFIEYAQRAQLPLALFSQRFLFDPAPLWQAYKLLKKNKMNIIETHGYKGHVIAWLLHRWLPIQWIVVAHGWTDENLKIRLYNRLEKWLIRGADHAIAVSPQLLRELKTIRGPHRASSLILNAVDPETIPRKGCAAHIRQDARQSADTKIMGVVGRLSPEKGHAILLEAVANLLNPLDAVLLIIGEGPLSFALKNQVKRLGLQQRVLFLGQRDNVGDYYDAMDLLILPSLSEGLPFVVLEAMSAGTPVLATQVGAVDQVITHNETGWIVPPGNASALAQQLSAILNDDPKRIQTGRQAQRALFPRFSPARQAQEVLEVYRATLQAKDA